MGLKCRDWRSRFSSSGFCLQWFRKIRSCFVVLGNDAFSLWSPEASFGGGEVVVPYLKPKQFLINCLIILFTCVWFLYIFSGFHWSSSYISIGTCWANFIIFYWYFFYNPGGFVNICIWIIRKDCSFHNFPALIPVFSFYAAK